MSERDRQGDREGAELSEPGKPGTTGEKASAAGAISATTAAILGSLGSYAQLAQVLYGAMNTLQPKRLFLAEPESQVRERGVQELSASAQLFAERLMAQVLSAEADAFIAMWKAATLP